MPNPYWKQRELRELTEEEWERRNAEMDIIYEACRDHGTVIEDEDDYDGEDI